MAVYQWLFKTIHKNSQDVRIRGLLELEAFLEIHRNWKRLGYPFDSLVPSLATAIGSSADHPAALAELMGIILNNGVRVPTVLIERIRFAADTPFETIVERASCQRRKNVFSGIGRSGTWRSNRCGGDRNGSRLARAIVEENGAEILIGGKDRNRRSSLYYFFFARCHQGIPCSKSLCHVCFFIGDRFFGTMTAFVPGADAANYKFTSALSTQVMKHLSPGIKTTYRQGSTLA